MSDERGKTGPRLRHDAQLEKGSAYNEDLGSDRHVGVSVPPHPVRLFVRRLPRPTTGPLESLPDTLVPPQESRPRKSPEPWRSTENPRPPVRYVPVVHDRWCNRSFHRRLRRIQGKDPFLGPDGTTQRTERERASYFYSAMFEKEYKTYRPDTE